jgi:RNA polymerase sigma-B factor
MLQLVTDNQEVKLLQAYRTEPSDLLRQQIVELHFDLIHPAIRAAINQVEYCNSPSYLSLLEYGAVSLCRAIEQFNPETEASSVPFSDNVSEYIPETFPNSFRKFAKTLICEYAKNQIHSNLIENQDSKIDITQYIQAQDITQYIETKEIQFEAVSELDSNLENVSSKKHVSFRLSSKDSKSLQKVVAKLDSQTQDQSSESDSDREIVQLKSQTWQLLKQYQDSPSVELRNHIVNLNLGLARKEAFHWTNQCTEPFEDLLQVGVMGLIRAIERFNCDRQNAFSSFAVPYIRGEIQHYLRDKSCTVRIPRQWLETYNQACKILPGLREKLHREPTGKEISLALNISLSEWQEVRLACQNRQPVSLDSSIGNDEDDGGSVLGDLMPDLKYRSFQLAQEDNSRLYHGLSHLEDRTREIIEFVFLKEFTHRQVSEILGISAVTVSRQVKKGLEILKQVMNTPLDL